VDLLALIIASFGLPSVTGAVVLGVLGYWAWGWMGAVIGAVIGYPAGEWISARYLGTPLSPSAKGWLSIVLFLGGLAALAIATR
jgi:hypothetical protein